MNSDHELCYIKSGIFIVTIKPLSINQRKSNRTEKFVVLEIEDIFGNNYEKINETNIRMECNKECKYSYKMCKTKKIAYFSDFYPKQHMKFENGYTGVCYTYHNTNDTLKEEFYLVNGKKNGELYYYNDKGILLFTHHYIDDKLIMNE